jgi:hypothetical protein
LFSKVLLFAGFLASVGCSPYLLVNRGVVNREKFQEIKNDVAALRGLEFKAEIPVEVKDRAGMRRYFEDDLAQNYGDEKLKNIALVYARLGLFPEGVDLKKSLLDLYAAQVAALYDPKLKKMILTESLGAGTAVAALDFVRRRDFVGEMVLAHELTHALQDQHFSLESKLGPSDNDDKDLAFHAVAEGDATLSGFGYLLGGVDEKSLGDIERDVQGDLEETRSTLSGAPEALVEELLFQYYGGVSFVSRILKERGWAAVNRLYASPPLSTEQILHPEKYFSSPDPPMKIEIKDLSALFSGWKEIENNVLGELMILVLFRRFFPAEEAKTVAAGWGGDRFVAFARGEEIAFIWATAWDTDRDAVEFTEAYHRLLGKKYPEKKAGALAAVERRGRRVIVVEGLEPARVKKQIEKIWQGIRIEKEPFASPFAPADRPMPAGAEQTSP